MSDNTPKIWYKRPNAVYDGDEPFFFEAKDFEWAKYMEANWEIIRDELKVLFDDDPANLLKPYLEDTLQYPPKNWKTESFYFWTKTNRQMCGLFPKTDAIIRQVPGLLSASVNLLEPHTKILPHCGATNAIVRCHLGIKIPKGLPECGFKVGTETRQWENGKMLIFLDAHTHEGFNNSDEKRFILLLDVIRPEFRHKKYVICTHIMGLISLYFMTNNYPKLRKFLESLPKAVMNMLVGVGQVYWWGYLTLQRNLFSTHLK